MADNTIISASTGNTTTKSLLIGRDKEVSQILDDIQNTKSSIWLLTGESGIGKSALLDELDKRLTKGDDSENNTFVGYYSKDQSLIAEDPQSPVYPFNIALSSLIKGAKSAQSIEENADITINRLKKAFKEFVKEEGAKIVEAILEDVTKKAGLEETLKIGKGFWSRFKSQKSSIMLTEDFVSKHKEEVLTSYIDIFKALVQEFKERQFVLIFDQFEYVGKASIDFLLNFIKLMSRERLHVIVSFRTDDRTWNDSSFRKMYEDIQTKLIDEMNGKPVNLQGLTAQDIGRWIEMVRGVTLPLTPDLQRIRERSAGLPLILDEWIRTSNILNYEEISDKKPCKQIIKLQDELTEEQRHKLYMLSVLLYPLKYKMLSSYLKMVDMPSTADLFRRLQESRIFVERCDEFTGKKYKWFRHELLQRCFYGEMDDEEKEYFHHNAATFFINLENEQQRQQQERQEKEKQSTQIENEDQSIANREYESSNTADIESIDYHRMVVSIAYHLHMSGKFPEESYRRNRKLGDYASKIGDLDLAERCYKMAIKDIEQLQSQKDETNRQIITSEEMSCLNDLASNVYNTWGRYEETLSNYQYVLAYAKENNDLVMESRVLNNIGIIHDKKGEYDQALKMYDQSLEILKKIRNRQGIGHILNNIAMLRDKKGEYDQALDLYNQSLEISKAIGDQYIVGRTLHNIAMLHHNKGEYDQALKMYNQSLEIKEELGDRQGIAYTLNNIAMLHDSRGEYEDALYNVLKAHEILRRLDIPELQRSLDIISSIKEKLGKEFDDLKEKVQKKIGIPS